MNYLAITTCNQSQWEQYGRAMATTFCRHWPSTVPLRVYAEGFQDIEQPVECIALEAAAPWLSTWKALYRTPQYNGGENGRDYRHDAVRFAHKVAALGAAVDITGDGELYLDGQNDNWDVLIWIDADTITHSPVTADWLDGLFPEPAVVAWLDRDNCYPECGFLMFRMPAARKIIREVVKAYRNGAIFKLPEWHDSYVIQHVVQKSGVPVHSLSGPEGRKYRGHPWVASELASRMDHLKGTARKAHGRSLPQDLKVPRPEPYWQ